MILKNPRIIIWIFFVAVAILLISPNPDPVGFVVSSPGDTGLTVGEVLYRVDGQEASQVVLEKNYEGIIKVDTNKGVKFLRVNGTLDIIYEPAQSTNIKFGLDIKGGVRAVIEPNVSNNATIDLIIDTLEDRINFYGLRESVFRPIYYGDKGFVEISIAGGNEEELRTLIESQGNFEAKIPFVLPVSGGQTSLKLDRTYNVAVSNSSIIVNNEEIRTGGSFSINNVGFTLNTVSPLNLTARIFDGEDIITVFLDPQRTRIEPTADGFSWTFGVQLSGAGAQRFAWVTDNVNPRRDGYLESPIEFYLDGELIDSLNIATSLKGRSETEIVISGGSATLEEAKQEMARLQSILRSGALPTTVEIVQLDAISPSLGAGFLKSAVLAAAAALLGVIVLVSLRYRRPKLVLPMVLISVTEILIVVGLSVLLGWTIDLAAIAGLIASVGTGISDQIIILDRTLRREDDYAETTKEKIKKAFFVVFGTAGTVIAAMLPLLFTGFGILRGFALITIIGVLVGILITRPAYGVILERMKKD